MRRVTIIALIATMLGLLTAAGAHARTGEQFRVEGRGWGHGIGLSQYGAQGYAQRGWGYQRIIRHYYSGSIVAQRPASSPSSLRVLLQSYLAPARIQMTSAGIVRQGTRSVGLAVGDVVQMRNSGRHLVVTRVRAGAPNVIVSPTATAADATIVPQVDGGARILFDADHAPASTSFRGTLTGHRFDGAVSVFNTVDLESYLRGVVPDEIPPSWHPQALRAQAVAARSYALRSLRTDYNWFDVYSDTRSQVYGGKNAEDARSSQAVAATAGQVARVGSATGEVVHAFFFSTSGGRTAGNDEVWGSTPYSYLRSVPSPYETASPYFFWRGDDIRRYTPRELATALGLSGSVRSAANTAYASGYARAVTIRTTTGTVSRPSPTDVQSRLGLRSTFFRLRHLRVSGPDTAAAGTYVQLTGLAPTAGVTTLELRQGAQIRAVALSPDASGRWTVRVRVGATLSATMVRSGITGPGTTVRVA